MTVKHVCVLIIISISTEVVLDARIFTTLDTSSVMYTSLLNKTQRNNPRASSMQLKISTMVKDKIKNRPLYKTPEKCLWNPKMQNIKQGKRTTTPKKKTTLNKHRRHMHPARRRVHRRHCDRTSALSTGVGLYGPVLPQHCLHDGRKRGTSIRTHHSLFVGIAHLSLPNRGHSTE